MQTKLTTMPEWNFVGGETQKRTFTLYKPSGIAYDIPNGTASLAIVDFVNRTSSPSLTKQSSVTADANGKSCKVAFTLDPSDTVSLFGKYLYQVTIKDGNGNASIPYHGIMVIARNIDQLFLSGT